MASVTSFIATNPVLRIIRVCFDAQKCKHSDIFAINQLDL